MITLRRPSLGTSPMARREARWGLLFLSPWVLGFLGFTLFPMIATLAFSFSNINLAQGEPLRFVGTRNYETLVHDSQVWESLAVTVKFAVLALPIGVLLPLAVALLLNSKSLKGTGVFRVLFFMPYVVPFIAGVLIWQGMLSTDTGWIYPALVFIGVWGIGGGIIINLAGLRGVPSELYDAARIDGAGWWGQLRHVTLPMMSPVIFYALILGVVELFQYFLVPLVVKNGTGEPGGTTFFYNLYLYKNFFTFQNMSYGAALAWLLFALILIVTVILFRTSRRWVYYAGER